MSSRTSLGRRAAFALIVHAKKMMPPSRSLWADAMEHELQHIEAVSSFSDGPPDALLQLTSNEEDAHWINLLALSSENRAHLFRWQCPSRHWRCSAGLISLA